MKRRKQEQHDVNVSNVLINCSVEVPYSKMRKEIGLTEEILKEHFLRKLEGSEIEILGILYKIPIMSEPILRDFREKYWAVCEIAWNVKVYQKRFKLENKKDLTALADKNLVIKLATELAEHIICQVESYFFKSWTGISEKNKEEVEIDFLLYLDERK